MGSNDGDHFVFIHEVLAKFIPKIVGTSTDSVDFYQFLGPSLGVLDRVCPKQVTK